MARKSSRRRTGTDVNQLWNLPVPIDRSSTGAVSNALIVDLDQKMTELRDLLGQIRTATAEAHGLLKDLRTESRQARRLLPMIVSKRIAAEVTRQLDELVPQVQRIIKESTDFVDKRFSDLADIYLETDRKAIREGKPSLETLAHVSSYMDYLNREGKLDGDRENERGQQGQD